ncbi:hypothetical protein BG000_011129 [Podila horticola]|nr:hypothetical protein BG000_011129 [Podila horticola]
MHKGKLIFAEGFGKRNKHHPFTPETHSMIGSITKAFTATTVGELVAEGKMVRDATPVNTYLPDFETIDPTLTSQLTMQDLLSHRTADANVAGVTLEQLVHVKIFKPLGLSNTGFSMAEMSKNKDFAMPNYADSYEDAVAGRFIETPLDAPAKMIAATGDMYATVLDLIRWGQVIMKEGMQDGKQILSKEGIFATLTAHTILRPALRDPDLGLSEQYGMGWILGTYKGNNYYQHCQLHMTLEAFKGVLTHYHFDTFTTVLRHTEERFGKLVTFSTGADDRVVSVSFAAPFIPDAITYAKK